MNNQTNNTLSVEQLKEHILRYDELAQSAYSVQDGNLYEMYKDLRDLFIERYNEVLRDEK